MSLYVKQVRATNGGRRQGLRVWEWGVLRVELSKCGVPANGWMTRRPEQRWRQSAEKGEKSILTMSELASMFSALLNWLCHCCTPSIHGLSTARLLLAQPEAILLVTEPKCLQKGAGQAAPPVGAPSLSSSSRWWSRLHQALAQLALAASCTCGSRRRAWFSAVSSKTSQAHAVRSCVDRWTSACWARAESPSPLTWFGSGRFGGDPSRQQWCRRCASGAPRISPELKAKPSLLGLGGGA